MFRTLPFLLLALFLLPVRAQTSLQYNLRKGQVFRIKQEAVQQIAQEIEGTTHEITNSIEGILEFRVLAVRDETYELSVTFKDLQLYMYSSSEGELLDINAADTPEGDVQARIFHSILDIPIHIVLDRSGDVLSVTGGDTLVARMADASGVEDTFTRELMKESLERDFGSEALSNSYEQMTYIYPKNKIRIGDRWKNEYKGKVSSSNSWILNALQGGHASIQGEASVMMRLHDAASSMSLTGTRTTEISTELSSGFLLAMKVRSQSSGVSAIPQLGSDAIPTTIRSTITYKRI